MAAYEFRGGGLHVKDGWPASTDSGGQSPEARGLAAADLDGDGTVEVVATTTNTSPTGAQVFVFDATGALFQPAGGHSPAWPRYNQLAGPGNDLRFNQVGNHGYGAYGENVAIGNIDDDADLEIITTFDNHQINAFNLDGTSILASPWFTNRESGAEGRRMGWGQFIRWADPGSSGATTTCTPGLGQARRTNLAAVDRVAACSGRPRRRRPQRGDRAPQRRAAHPLPHPGYAFMVLDARTATGGAPRAVTGLREAADVQPPGPPARAATGTRPAASRRRPSSTSSATTGPRSSRPCPAARSTPSLRTATGSGPPSTRRGARRPSPPRWSRPTSTRTAARAGLRHLRAAPQRRTPGRALGARQKLSVTRLSHQGQDGNGIGVAAAPSHQRVLITRSIPSNRSTPVSSTSLLPVCTSDLSEALQHRNGVKKELAEPYADTTLFLRAIRRHGGRLDPSSEKRKPSLCW